MVSIIDRNESSVSSIGDREKSMQMPQVENATKTRFRMAITLSNKREIKGQLEVDLGELFLAMNVKRKQKNPPKH